VPASCTESLLQVQLRLMKRRSVFKSWTVYKHLYSEAQQLLMKWAPLTLPLPGCLAESFKSVAYISRASKQAGFWDPRTQSLARKQATGEHLE